MTTPRIYVACLASYNNGVLHGMWIDATSDKDEMMEDVAAMLRTSKFPNVTVKHPETGELVPSAEEWAIHDMEGLPSNIGEYSGLTPVADFMELVEEHDTIDPDDLCKIVAEFRSVSEAASRLAGDYVGTYDSFRDYADERADEMMACHGKKVPEEVARYFDYESYARDLSFDMTTVELSTGVAVFHS